MTVQIKRVYDTPKAEDGARVLVDRLWPRGLTKEAAALDLWSKDVSPSEELRKWYHAHLQQWAEFRKRYLRELSNDTAHIALQQLYDLAEQKRGLTLVYASKDVERNNALVLKQLLDGERKPPTGTGPERVASAGRARAVRRR
jgi:uncharacterized protein YeaO (DUF488 family)